ncbi:MAG TPA: hypothetical protein VJN18_22380 [Polyangiaceae bacterium]|nr:hypothetical protein [Polyangiaceae bacterium]
MSSRTPGAVAVVGAALVSGCSFGTFQTAHTQAPATVSVTPGATYVSNAIDDQQGRGPLTNAGAQLGARVGITEHVDAGVGSFLLSGLKADVKVNVLGPHQNFAIAPRFGAGGRLGREIWMLEGGAIASYLLFERFEPYLGLTFANHWIEPDPPLGPLPPNVVGKSGTGDGLLQLSLGVELVATRHFAVLAEYGHWFVLHDDPGDFYRFLATNVVGVAMRFGRVRR